MGITAGELIKLSDDELLSRLGGAQAGSTLAYAVESEFRRRALIADQASADATKKSAEAAERAAKAAEVAAYWQRMSAIGVFLTVVVMAASMFITR